MVAPVGNGSAGAAHTYDWVIPDEPSVEVRVQVVQDNVAGDYTDISNGDLTIVSGPIFVDGYESGNLLIWSEMVP